MSTTNKRSSINWQLCVGLATLFSMSVSAATIYDNSVNDLQFRFNPGTNEVGDEILLSGGPGQLLVNFSFEFYGTNNSGGGPFAGNVKAQVRFYENNGPLFNGFPTPGPTPFYDSGPFAVPTTDALGRNTFVFTAGADFPNGGLFLPATDMTWSVQFSGMAGTDEAGVDIYDPVVAGSNFPDYWEHDAGGWTLRTNVVNMNFAAKFETPEPSSVALVILGGLGLLFASRRRGRQ